MKKIIKDALILFAITLVAGILLGYVHEITLEPIAKAQQEAANATYRKVFSEAAEFLSDTELSSKAAECSADPAIQEFGSNVAVYDMLTAVNQSGEKLGYVVIASAKGYGGPVKVAVGINNDGSITGLGFLSISETPGLGMKAKEDSFTSQFAGMTDVESMDAISGATYTSKAVKGALRASKYCFENYTE